MNEAATIDFRTRTGQMRRARTRKRILTAAFDLFDQHGVGRVTIDQVRQAAGLSRGTFYNYFATYEAMLIEIAQDITLQINKEQDVYIAEEPDNVLRMFRTMSYFLARAASDRACCEILVRVIPLVGSPTDTMQDHAMHWFTEAQRTGLIRVPSLELALEAGYGIGSAILRRALHQGTNGAEIAWANLMFLRALGVSDQATQGFESMLPPDLPDVPLRALIVDTESPDGVPRPPQ